MGLGTRKDRTHLLYLEFFYRQKYIPEKKKIWLLSPCTQIRVKEKGNQGKG